MEACVENTEPAVEEGEICDDSQTESSITSIFDIVFTRLNDYQKYGDTIIKVLKEHLVFDGKRLSFSTTLNDKADNGVGVVLARIQAFEPEKDKIIEINDSSGQSSDDSQDFGEALNNLFRIDASPSTSLESARVPSYKRAVKDFLDEKIEVKAAPTTEACTRPKPRSSCFNCGGFDHSIRDCRIPRCLQRINRAKKARLAKTERYHVDVDQRFAHLRPGVITEKLKKALRLRPGELPSYIYRMRIFGYPPGWLEEAKVSESGLALFKSGDDVLKSEESYDLESDIKYDIAKIIEYPGFNTSPGSNFYDDYKHHNVPPLSKHLSREEMIKALGDSAVIGFKRRKITDDPIETPKPTDTKVAPIADPDMDIEDDLNVHENVEIEYTRPMPPPLPPTENDLPPLPPSHSPSLQPNSLSDDERSHSPTLDELKARQRALLMKLECSGDLQSEDEITLDKSNCTENSNVSVTPATPRTPSTPNNELKTIIKSSHMGTPVLQFSPFEKLPAGENFKVGVSDVINFENLPDSTGKYESMKDVLKKIRSVKKQLDAEEN